MLRNIKTPRGRLLIDGRHAGSGNVSMIIVVEGNNAADQMLLPT